MSIKIFLTYLFSLYQLVISLGCCTSETVVLSTSSGNREQREATIFLLEQIDKYYGVSLRYTNSESNNLNTFINNYLGENEDIMESLHTFPVVDILWDSANLHSDFLTNTIKLAQLHYHQNPLGKQFRILFFMNIYHHIVLDMKN